VGTSFQRILPSKTLRLPSQIPALPGGLPGEYDSGVKKQRSSGVRRVATVALIVVAVSVVVAVSGIPWLVGKTAQAADPDQPPPGAAPKVLVVRRLLAVPYATIGNETLFLDLYNSSEADDAVARPLIIFIHGGGWMTGRRADIPKEIILFVDLGYVVASIDYRSSRGNAFLANVHDVKAAVRFLRAHADGLRIDPATIALVGFASGGHLAALAGLAAGDLEGTVGDHDDVSSVVQAAVSFQGPMNLETILVQKTPTGMGKHRVPVELLLGGPPEKRAALAIKASPVGHVRRDSPPLLLVYGGADDQVPAAQGREMAEAYRKHGATAELHVIEEAEHKSLLRFDSRRETLLAEFLERRLQKPD
jgi:acetyl esterase/lipase